MARSFFSADLRDAEGVTQAQLDGAHRDNRTTLGDALAAAKNGKG
jgi:hypothetical protein